MALPSLATFRAFVEANPSPVCACGCGGRIVLKPYHAQRGIPTHIQGHNPKPAPAPLLQRLLAKADTSGGPASCWLWKGGHTNAGYGCIKDRGGMNLAHRVSYALHKGPIPDGMVVMHDCPGGDDARCINPAHLKIGTMADNAADMAKKGRSARGEKNANARLTDADVVDILRRHAAGERRAVTARHYNIDRAAIRCIVLNLTWRHIPRDYAPA